MRYSFAKLAAFPEEWATRLVVPPNLMMILLSLLVGFLTAVGAVLFRYAVRFLYRFFFVDGAYLFTGQLHPAMVLFPAVGGLVVGLIVHFFLDGESGHGVASVMEAVALAGGKFPPLAAFVRIIGSIVTLGSGGSAGPEDPSVQIGAAIGSGIGQVLHLRSDYMRTLVAAGAAGGISSAFNAPIAGVFFALEIVLGDFSAAAFGTVVIASVTSVAVTGAMIGNHPEFAVSAYSFTSYWEFFFYLGLGLLAAIVSVLYIQGVTLASDYWHSVAVPRWLKPALGGLLVGGIGFFLPTVLGVGYESVDIVLAGTHQWTILLLLLIVVAKIFTTSMTLGSGGIGGLFAPSLFLGAMLGGAYGMLLQLWFPAIASSPGAYAMVGMAAVLAGAVHAPITAILLLFEMTRDYRIILPLMFATVISTFISQSIFEYSVYTLALFRQGIRLERVPAIDVTQGVKVWEVMTEEVDTVPLEMTLSELEAFFTHTWHHGAPVVDKDGKLVGLVTRKDLQRAQEVNSDHAGSITVGDIAVKELITVCPGDPVWVALKKMSSYDIGRLPVVECSAPQRLVGMIRRSDIVRAYRIAISRRREKEEQSEEMRLARLTHMRILEMEVKGDSFAAHRSVKDLNLPPGCLLTAVERGDKRLVVHGDLRFLPGDKVFALMMDSDTESLQALFSSPEEGKTVHPLKQSP